VGGSRGLPNKNIFFAIFKIRFMFPGNDFHSQFYYADRQWKSIFTGGSQLPVCKNDDFYWLLALAVTKNATVNRFTTATIELICTSGICVDNSLTSSGRTRDLPYAGMSMQTVMMSHFSLDLLYVRHALIVIDTLFIFFFTHLNKKRFCGYTSTGSSFSGTVFVKCS
jgi:hypothetical protein